MTAHAVDDEQEILRLTQLMMDSAHRGGVETLRHYIDDNYLLTYSLFEQDKHGFWGKEQVIAKWGSQELASGSGILSEQRVLVSGDTAVSFALITDKFSDNNGEQIIRTWVSDVWVRRNGEWRWLASHESFLK